ncbi:hypothetical protein BHE74_00055929, partial [Ensete ventricosum]
FLSLVSKLRSCALSLLPFIIHTIAASLAIYIAIAIIVVIAIFHPLLLPPSANPRLLPSTPPAHSSVVTTAFCSPITTISTSPFFLPCHYCCLAAIFLPSSSVPVATCHCHLPFSSHYSHLYAVNPSATMLPCIVALPLLPPSYTLLCVALASVVIVPFLPSPTLAVDTPHQTLFLHCFAFSPCCRRPLLLLTSLLLFPYCHQPLPATSLPFLVIATTATFHFFPLPQSCLYRNRLYRSRTLLRRSCTLLYSRCALLNLFPLPLPPLLSLPLPRGLRASWLPPLLLGCSARVSSRGA